jgi:hypothetical protein
MICALREFVARGKQVCRGSGASKKAPFLSILYVLARRGRLFELELILFKPVSVSLRVYFSNAAYMDYGSSSTSGVVFVPRAIREQWSSECLTANFRFAEPRNEGVFVVD